MKFVVRSLLFFLQSVITGLDYCYNYFLLKFKRVSFVGMPTIHGRLVLFNDGTFELGENCVFNCSLTSNMVGLFKGCTIAVIKGGKLSIGKGSGFSGVSIYCSKSIRIGRFVNFGGNVSIWDTDFHPLDYLARRKSENQYVTSLPIEIGDDVFVGANSIILKGVSIGARSIIGAGSVVTKDVPKDEVWAGNPAKFIRRIN